MVEPYFIFIYFCNKVDQMQRDSVNIAILASGSGSNAEQISQFLKDHKNLKVKLIATNKKDAYVIERAKKMEIPYLHFTRKEMEEEQLLSVLRDKEIDLLVLAGFLLKVPENIIQAFPNRIINIHPALLPKYGGKGMYGMHVHKAVKANCEDETGITIHFVNEHYDEGAIIFQAKTLVSETDSAEDIAEKIHLLEYDYFPKVVEEVAMKLL